MTKRDGATGRRGDEWGVARDQHGPLHRANHALNVVIQMPRRLIRHVGVLLQHKQARVGSTSSTFAMNSS